MLTAAENPQVNVDASNNDDGYNNCNTISIRLNITVNITITSSSLS
jgi:hypothetical protein